MRAGAVRKEYKMKFNIILRFHVYIVGLRSAVCSHLSVRYGAVEMTAVNISIIWPDNNDTRNRRGLMTCADSST